MTDQTPITQFDAAKAEAFAERFVGTLNEAALAVMTSLGHRAGLLDGLAANPGLTSIALAETIGVNERYLREWLGVMVTSGVVDYEPRARSYTLPPEHAAFLTRAASPDSMAVTTQFIVLAASIQDKLLERFRSGALNVLVGTQIIAKGLDIPEVTVVGVMIASQCSKARSKSCLISRRTFRARR